MAKDSGRRGREASVMRIRSLFAAAVLAGATVVSGTTAAHALQFQFEPSGDGNAKVWNIAVYNNGHYAGSANWNGDPRGATPGDALAAYDNLADGYGIVARLSTGREASTLGHTAGYFTGWVTGNLPEGHHYQMWVSIQKGTTSISSDPITVTS